MEGSSPIKRVSMTALLQQLQQQVGNAKQDTLPIQTQDKVVTNEQEEEEIVPVVIDSAPSSIPVVKESQIRRIKLPAGSISYSRNQFKNGPAIQVSVNPQLQRSSTTPSSTSTATTQLTTTESITTTEPTSTTFGQSQIPAKVYPSVKMDKKTTSSSSSSLRASTFGSQKRLSDMPNSPIYYIKLPSSAFVSVRRTPHSDDSSAFSLAKQSPIFVATTRRPGSSSSQAITVTTEATTVTTESSDDALSTTTRKPPRTNSRIINIKGPFVFNGKPGGIYSAPAPYRPPNYLDILHSIYPKLKRAQFIRR